MSLPFLKLRPESDLEWLAVAQHHGLPTRLLDWTRNALGALWFAVRKEAVGKCEGSVWVLNPTDEDFTLVDNENRAFATEYVKVYRPRHITERLIAQAGYFTLHGFNAVALRFDPLASDPIMRGKLTEMRIPPKAFSDLRDDLERCGVSDVTMFPDLDGVCRYITWNNSLMPDEVDPPNVPLNSGNGREGLRS